MMNNIPKSNHQDFKSNNRKEDEELKLKFVLVILGLDTLIPLVLSMQLSFVDFILLSKQDVIKLNLDLYQRNRILNFIQSYKKTCIEYSFEEVILFFNKHRQFIFIQLKQPITYQSAILLIDTLINSQSNISKGIGGYQFSIKSHVKNKSDQDNKEEQKGKIKEDNTLDNQRKSQSQHNNKGNKKLMSHSQTVDPSLRKAFRGTDNLFYQSYIKMNKDTDNLLNNLRKSKEESESKHSKYISLLKRNNNTDNISGNNSSRLASNNIIKEDDTQLHSGIMEESNIKESKDIKMLYDMINKKESLVRNLKECNKSINEKKKVSNLLLKYR